MLAGAPTSTTGYMWPVWNGTRCKQSRMSRLAGDYSSGVSCRSRFSQVLGVAHPGLEGYLDG